LLSGCGGDSEIPSAQSQIPEVSPPLAAPKDTNSAPTIAGTLPNVIEVGKAFSFLPTASDADQDKLQFSIASKPSWLAFDPATGRLTGTPTQKDVGTHEDIVVSVSDGQATASLPKTAVTVQNAATASATDVTISWEPPTQNTDGSALVDLSGYKLYYGTASQNYSKSVAITNPGLTRYVLEDLTPGTYYFSITAVSKAGTESTFSAELTGDIG
jgi:hypothetical protein